MLKKGTKGLVYVTLLLSLLAQTGQTVEDNRLTIASNGTANVFSVALAEESKVLWQIGKSDNDMREFALSPDAYSKFGDHFGYADQFFVVGLSDPAQHWPYVLPGAQDPWVGGIHRTINRLPIYFQLKHVSLNSECVFVIDCVGINPQKAPTLRVVVNGHNHEYQLPAGRSDDVIQGRASEGEEYVLRVPIPASELKVGTNEIQLMSIRGSWTVFDCVRLEGTGVSSAVPSPTLIHSVQAAKFSTQQDGDLYQPLLVDVTQYETTGSLTVTVHGLPAQTKQLELGRSILEFEMPVVEINTATPVCVQTGTQILLETNVTRGRVDALVLSDYVDPFIGTADSRWMLTPGPWMPLSMVKISPINQDWQWKGGYEYAIENIAGFDHIHSWTMAGLLMMPVTGALHTQPGPAHDPDKGYRSHFDRKTEKAGIGFYEVILKDYDIKAELTATTRAAMQRYTFPKSDSARVLIDLEFPAEHGYRNQVTESRIARVSDREVEGYSKFKGGGWSGFQDYVVYFAIQFSRPFASMGGWVDKRIDQDTAQVIGQGDVGAFVNFETSAREQILVRSSISFVSIDQARLNLTEEIIKPFGWSFAAIVENQRRTWSQLFKRVEIETDDHLQKVKFYTNLYRAFCARTIMSDVNGKYADMYEKTQQLADPESPILGCDAFWNTFWNLNQLWNLVTPDIANQWVQSLLEIYDKGGWLPKGPAGVEYTSIMVAEHAIPLIVAVYQQGIRDYDVDKAFEAMVHAQTTPAMQHPAGGHVGNRELLPYLKYGYIPVKHGHASNTMEYAYDDWCVAQMAKALGAQEEYEIFSKRGEYWRNLYDPNVGFMRARYPDGRWLEKFSPFDGRGGWVEGNPWQFTWFVPQNVRGLAEAMGREQFIQRLDEGLIKSEPSRFNATGDRMGAYPINHGNQPSMQVAWMFNHAGAPWLTQKWTRSICNRYYGTGPSDGYPGDEDQGQMSAWFAMSAIGLFQIDGGCRVNPIYEIGSPLYDRVTLNLHDKYYHGNTFVIEVRNNSKTNMYVQSATLNGKPLTGPWFYHSQLVEGGKLVLEMGPTPNKTWGSSLESAPPVGR